MLSKVNFHTHSHFCDGKGELREYVQYAIDHHFSILGFSGHAPMPFENNFAISPEKYTAYCDEVRSLQQEFASRLDIRLGLEIDYVSGAHDDFTPLLEQGRLDYFIGGVHLVVDPDEAMYLRNHPAEAANHLWFIDGPSQETYDEGLDRIFHGDIRRGVRAFFHQTNEMIESQHPPIVAHFNKIVMHNRNRYFTEDEKWYLDLAYETIALIHEVGCIAEVNTRGIYKKRHDDFYPSRHLLRHMNELGIPVLVGTDAHEPSNLDMFEGAYEYLNEIRYKNIVTDYQRIMR